MGLTLAGKILVEHVVGEEGGEIALRVDQTLTQDATGTMACLQFEALGIPRVRTRLSVSYVDHNMLQTSFENADDHAYLQSVAAKYGMLFSRPGNGICHQVHLERFAEPGLTLLGSDSHTPTAGGMGMIGIGAGGLDVAVAMGGGPFYVKKPKILGVRLSGRLERMVGAKDVILFLLKRLSVKGGVGKIVEYFGPGVSTLSVPERATITNMGAELGATTSIFPSDGVTREFLEAQGRAGAWRELKADEDAEYDEVIDVDLSEVEPLAARPHSPDNVAGVKALEGTRVSQVLVGSCTNSSVEDLLTVAAILKGRKIHASVSFAVVPGSRQVLAEITRNGALAGLISAGARILESACGPCIGMGLAPSSKGVSLRTFNRNFEGRSGTKDAQVYLVGPEVAAASALSGVITDPRGLDGVSVSLPERFAVDDSMIVMPPSDGSEVEVVRGPNIAALPSRAALEDSITGKTLIKTGDNVSTDHIMPAGAKILPLRSNVPKISEFVFSAVDPEFVKRAKEWNGGFIIGGDNYGQGSSREHAALAPMYLGVKAVIAKSFARIHEANLVNFGIVPLAFENPADYDDVCVGDELEITGVRGGLEKGLVAVNNKTKGKAFAVRHSLGKRFVGVLLAGGLLNFTREAGKA